MQRRQLLLGSAASIAACGITLPAKPLYSDDSFTQTLHPAKPAQGFNFPYILQTPSQALEATVPHLIVETNNSGPISGEIEPHVQPTSELARQGLGGRVSLALKAPLLMPVFPREPSLYTHSLGRATILTSSKSLRRLDLQLLAMARDAKRQLSDRGSGLRPKLLLTGFSASAMFATRLAAIHPSEIAAVVAGGLNGLVILPVKRLAEAQLQYPLGIADLEAVSGRAFDENTWRQVPQLLFMGALDTNDAVDFEDSYSSNDRTVIHRLLGKRMIPDRWQACERVFQSARAPATFKIYANLAHGTNGQVHREAAAFLKEAVGAARPQ
jgi:hypothetical protein